MSEDPHVTWTSTAVVIDRQVLLLRLVEEKDEKVLLDNESLNPCRIYHGSTYCCVATPLRHALSPHIHQERCMRACTPPANRTITLA